MLFVFRKRNEKITVIKNMAGSEKKHSPTANVGPQGGSQTPSVRPPQLGPSVTPHPAPAHHPGPIFQDSEVFRNATQERLLGNPVLEEKKRYLPATPRTGRLSLRCCLSQAPTHCRADSGQHAPKSPCLGGVGGQMCFVREDGGKANTRAAPPRAGSLPGQRPVGI